MRPVLTSIAIASLIGTTLCVLSPVLALAKTPDTDLRRIESELDKGRAHRDALQKKAAGFARELKTLKSDMVETAKVIQSHEADALELENRLQKLAREETAKASRLHARRGQFMQVLMALERMATYPPETIIAAPQSPADTIRGAILLRTAAPEIERRAGVLRADLNALSDARTKIRARRQELALAVTGLAENRRYLKKLMMEKSKLKIQADAGTRKAERRIRDLVGKARNLRDLMARLEADRRKRIEEQKEKTATATGRSESSLQQRAQPTITSLGKIEKSRGKLPFPVVGRLVGRYGQATETGLTRKGITIETRPGAQVVAPFGGQVMFAGAFKGYGQLLIIEHAGGYHSLLAGLARIDSVIGQQILSGEPAGVMGGGETDAPILYVELRRNGQPINPLPWLAARKSKVNG